MSKINWQKTTARQRGLVGETVNGELAGRDRWLYADRFATANARKRRNAKRSVMPQTKAEARQACEQAYDDWLKRAGDQTGKPTALNSSEKHDT